MKKTNSYLLLFFVVVLFSGINYSLPRFALRMGGQCADCHVNPTGGELRNDGGWKFGRSVLPMVSAHKKLKMSNILGENIYFGVDYRTQYIYSQQLKRTDFQKMSGQFYTDINVDEKVDVYGMYDIINQFWEAYGVAHFLPNNSYIKVGTYSPNYGIRVDDHTAYTRGGDLGFISNLNQGLIYQPGYTETGIEIGAYFSNDLFLTASVGNPHPGLFSSDPAYTASLQYTPVIAHKIPLLIGGSFTTFKGLLGPLRFSTFPKVKMYGGFWGFGIGDFTLLGEYDIAKDYNVIGTSANALMVKGNYQIIKGLEAAVRYDRFDPNDNVNKDKAQRWIFGFEIYPYSFIEIRPQYRLQIENPDIKNNSFIVQFHFYY
jgi:hypothetical protein